MIAFKVEDMTCNHCVMTVTRAVKALDAAAQVNIDLPSHRVQVETAKAPVDVESAIREAGYTPMPA